MNYEEFIEEYSNGLDKIMTIYFSSEEAKSGYTTLSDDPKKYINIASQCNGLEHVVLEEIQSQEYYKSAMEFIKQCDDEIKISNDPNKSFGGKGEFLRSEQIIEGIIEKINPEWTIKQKAAYVHYKIGEIISYTPDFCFSGKYANDSKSKAARNIWKSIQSGESVCNGIATIERNILSRIGIKTKELSSATHTFVMIKSEEGNIISDPTWDLSNTLFQGRPMYFGKSYEQLREIDGPFSKAHKLEEVPEDVVEISEEELREIYHSIGIANDDRTFKFPILDRVNEINNQQFDSNSEKVSTFLQMFTTHFSNQATHLSETRTMIERCIPALGIDAKSLTTKFVYSKEDAESEKPYLCLHIAGEDMQDRVAVLNIEQMKFDKVELKDFDEQYNPHDEDTREPFWKKYLQREEKEKSIEIDKSEK